MDFNVLKTAVVSQFAEINKTGLYRTQVTGDDMWRTYLASFPPGTDPIYRNRTEHDCSGCRSFIKAVGNAVTIVDNKVVSLWDIQMSEPSYQTVVDALAAFVKSQPIENVFLYTEPKAGTGKNFESILGQVKTYDHFFLNLPTQYVLAGKDIGPKLGNAQATHDVMARGLNEITLASVATVLELIGQNSIYRGEENRFAVTEFEKLKKKFDKLDSSEAKDLFVWLQMKSVPESISRMRNTSIGTLLTDLSEGKDVDEAVRIFESKVAPENYKRPTALVTKAMIQIAQQKIEDLGLMSALFRRHATLSDITVNNIIYANRSARARMTSNVFEDIAATMPEKAKNYDNVEEITIEKFIADVVPRAESIEVMLENRHGQNLVSLIAPDDPTAGNLFKWDNNFSWDYAGGYADSIKERIKKAGGSVTGDLCCRLAWFNKDDLDLFMSEPGGTKIYYGTKNSYATKGQLDVDMNVNRAVRDAVENIYYGNRRNMVEGIYTLGVNQFTPRESIDVGFEVEMDYLGTVKRFVYEKPLKRSETVVVARFKYSHAKGIEILESLPSTESSKTLWELPTQTFHKVNVLMYSPNYWDGQGVGNRHYFFMLSGAVREDTARGFYNEFLKNELDPHRKAFEMVGARMESEGTVDQLSGLGFSSTSRNEMVCRVSGASRRIIKIKF